MSSRSFNWPRRHYYPKRRTKKETFETNKTCLLCGQPSFLVLCDECLPPHSERDDRREGVSELTHEALLEWRGIEPGHQCEECGGAGVTAYGSTATWQGGIGGQAFTTGVCDKCWGSGNRHKPWPSHRLLRAPHSERGGLTPKPLTNKE